jgi:hypothetical protein
MGVMMLRIIQAMILCTICRMSKQIGARSLRSVVNQTFKGKDAFDIVVRTVGGVVAAYLIYKVATNAKGM